MFGKPKESVRFLDFNDVAEKFGEKKAVAIFDAIAGKKSKEHSNNCLSLKYMNLRDHKEVRLPSSD
ncbi:hypothetical protein [Clostridioides difficile]|uniref:hypothetical protein n=1 Tax=Clostridioides difficile TaxID=1496 RepID=UPI0018E9B97D|nr:hypothetical protein [Clostridioides difficile]